jgi:signal transduction histidine kinase
MSGLGYFRKFNLTIVFVIASTVAIGAYLIYEKATSDIDREEGKLEIDFKEKVQNVDNLLNALVREVEIMESEARNYDINPDNLESIRKRAEFRYLKQYDKTHYSIETLPERFRESTSSISGKGDLQSKLSDSSFVRELGMQFRLGSIFSSVKKQFPDITWAYSISENDFINVFPFASSKDMQYEPNYKEYDFYKLCLPENNPERQLRVSSAYMDVGGQGLMVTISKPFSANEKFAGIVAIDVTLATIKNYVKSFSRVQNSQMIVINDHQQVLANSYDDSFFKEDSTVVKITDIISGFQFPEDKKSSFSLTDGRVVRVASFSKLPWKAICISPDSYWLMSKDGKIYIGLMLSLAILLTMVLMFTKKNFIDPSKQLVLYIENESKNVFTTPVIHHSWKQWFDVVKNSFELNRKTIGSLDLRIRKKTSLLFEANGQLTIQKRNLEEAHRTKDKIFSIISHDLRSPINSLMGMLDLSKKGYMTADEFKVFAHNLEVSTKKVSAMLENLLHWSIHNLNSKKIEMTSVNIEDLIEENIQLYKTVASAKRIKIIHQRLDNIFVQTDRSVIDLVLRNLLMNAIKFSYEEGEIFFLTEKVGDEIVIRVRDYGKGIPETIRKKLFQPCDALQSGTANEKGTGLGLSLCKDFLEPIGGKIWADSFPENGSQFSFSIPYFKEEVLTEISL